MTIDKNYDRRSHPRSPKLMRMMLLWQNQEEKVFITDVSLNGLFIRTAVMPPHGSEVTLVVPNTGTLDEAVRIEATVIRVARRGDPANPLGGIGIAWDRIVSPKGTKPVIAFLSSLLGDRAPELPLRPNPIIMEMPAGHLRPMAQDGEEDESNYIEELGFDQSQVTADLAVFCRWKNMVIQANLAHLGNHQAILSNLKVLPEVGDQVSVRLVSSNQTMFRGLEFTGDVDLIKPGESASEGNVVSVAISPMEDQRERGGLRSLLEQLTTAKNE